MALYLENIKRKIILDNVVYKIAYKKSSINVSTSPNEFGGTAYNIVTQNYTTKANKFGGITYDIGGAV
jgi:hypothetical protein